MFHAMMIGELGVECNSRPRIRLRYLTLASPSVASPQYLH